LKELVIIYRIYPLFNKLIGGYGIMEILKVSAQSQPKSVAGALAAILREKSTAELQAVGAGAVNQAVKAIAITRGFVAPNGIDLVVVPAFSEITIDGEDRTAIKFLVEPR
jgi:stage V sporulation protein S